MEGQRHRLIEERVKGVLGEDLGEKQIIVGSPKNPVWIGPASEAKGFFTPEFDLIFELWRRFKAGMGLPGKGSWLDEEPDIADAILIFQEHWEAVYRDRPIISRLDALLQRG
jgi:hypothetical protein